MDFSLSEEQSMLADSVGKYMANDYDFETRQNYAGSKLGYSQEAWQTFVELGWTAVPFNEADGGFDGGLIELMLMMQHFGRGLLVEPYLANIILSGGVLKHAANDAQKERWLQPLIAGELQASLAFVEPQSRYEIGNVVTSAKPDADNWLLNGNKGVVLHGGSADLIIVPARTSGKQSDQDGITLFGIDADSPGVTRNSYATVDGLQAAEIRFENVHVEATSVIGDIGRGFDLLDRVIDEATLAVCSEATGIMRIMTEKTVEYSKSRVQFGVPISSFQSLQHRMVDMLTTCEQSYSLLLWALMVNEERGPEAKRAVSSIKYMIGTAGQKLGEEAVQIHGAMGMTWELDIAHYFKRLTAINQMFGSADWHLDQLARD
jgi:alkylation response protein AidB-like acyl-CoA dehydrogenase